MTARAWTSDVALDGFEMTTLPLEPDDDGALVATLVRRVRTRSTRRAVLYVHGFVDYFFQSHVAAAFAARGWDFYALDLRRYGRSLRADNRPNYCTNLAQYDAELAQALDIIRREEGHDIIALLGHSTGGLIASWYVHRFGEKSNVHALLLNSPFFDFAVPTPRRYLLPIVTALGAVLPTVADPKAISARYGETLLAQYHGEWTYNVRWKPVNGFPAYFGWIRAIRRVQAHVTRGLSVSCPVLLQHAARSMYSGAAWQEKYQTADIVLNIDHMKSRGPGLGADVTLQAFDDAVHDVYLSREPVRTRALDAAVTWLDSQTTSTTTAVRPLR